MSAVTPNAESKRNSVACVRIAATPTIALRMPSTMPLLMQLTALGPGVVTNTTQNRAKIVHASKLISIHRRGDDPDRHSGVWRPVGPPKRLSANAKAVAGAQHMRSSINLDLKRA